MLISLSKVGVFGNKGLSLLMIKKFLILNKKPILIFVIVFLTELLTIFILSQIHSFEIFLRGDGRDYQNLANNLIYHQTLAITSNPPYLPTSFRTPIYPFWLAFIYLIFKSYNVAIFIGAAVFAISSSLVYLIGREIFTEKIAITAAFLSGLEPWALFQAGFIAAEQIFMPIFLLSVYFFCRYLKSGSARHLYSATVILGISVLTRPATLLFIAIYVFLAFIFELRYSFWQSLKTSALIFLIFIAVLIPWLVRNKIVLNSWQFSSASGIRTFGDYIMLEKYIGKTNPNELVDIYEEAKKILGANSDVEAITTVENSEKLTQVALKGIKDNLSLFLKMHFENMALFFFKNSYSNVFFDFDIPDSNIQSKLGDYFKQNLNPVGLIREASLGAKILIMLAFFWPLIIFLAVVGVLKMFKKNRHDLLFWFLILWIIYFPFLVAWGDISRYRLSIHAPLFLLAVVGFYKILDYFFKHENLKFK